MEDPDGITVEIILEKPERLDRLNYSKGSAKAIDRGGTFRSPSAPLDVESVLKSFPDQNLSKSLADDTKVGHIHLYVADLEPSNQFYMNLCILQNSILQQYGIHDLSVGGAFEHRIAFNNWQSKNKPQAPEGTAGLRFYTIIFDSPERLQAALKQLPSAQKQSDGYLVSDPAGNKILLKAQLI